MLCRKCGKEIKNETYCPFCQFSNQYGKDDIPAHLQFIFDLINNEAQDPFEHSEAEDMPEFGDGEAEPEMQPASEADASGEADRAMPPQMSASYQAQMPTAHAESEPMPVTKKKHKLPILIGAVAAAFIIGGLIGAALGMRDQKTSDPESVVESETEVNKETTPVTESETEIKESVMESAAPETETETAESEVTATPDDGNDQGAGSIQVLPPSDLAQESGETEDGGKDGSGNVTVGPSSEMKGTDNADDSGLQQR